MRSIVTVSACRMTALVRTTVGGRVRSVRGPQVLKTRKGRADVFVALHDANCQPKPREGSDRIKRALAFGSANFQLRKEFQDAFPARAVNNKWYSKWDQEWFYAFVGVNFPLRSTNAFISYRREGVVKTSEDTLNSRILLLRRVAAKMSMRDLAEEFITHRLSPLARSWPEGLFQTSGQGGLSELAFEHFCKASQSLCLLYFVDFYF
ncbi:hypothetical protein GUJ93_ZPchr0299g33225 [Zizania palustris]|uniref:Uncharacterized protein n=1 Tax=Zizania palustris TaxID=103762 RepID=A0A8J5X5S4_ZIZPA|nr:hypothetical protein GUJ93_ZPchr0299g33225 [Zizania palustris]